MLPPASPKLRRMASSGTFGMRCAEAFKLIDKNGDGTLTRIEVIQASRSLAGGCSGAVAGAVVQWRVQW